MIEPRQKIGNLFVLTWLIIAGPVTNIRNAMMYVEEKQNTPGSSPHGKWILLNQKKNLFHNA